jgi:hypothetical protein
MVGTNGHKFPQIRQHLQENIANVYKDMDTSYATTIFTVIIPIDPAWRFYQFPEAEEVDPEAC